MTVNNTLLKSAWLALLVASALLTGCASLSSVVSEVSSFSGTPTAVKAGNFRFERLPSQEQDAPHAQALEAMAQAALEKVGFARNDAAAQYSVQVAAWTAEAVEVWPEPPMGRWGWSRFDRLRPWNGWSSLHGPWADHQVYLSKVRLEIRNLGDGKVVFEATATNEQSWFRADTILPALFEAALTSFPAATPTPHTVIVALPKG